MAIASTVELDAVSKCTFGKNVTIGSRAKAEVALESLYASLGRPRPAVVWCRSLYQLVTLPSLLIGILHSDIWQFLSGVFFYPDDDSEAYQEALNDAWAEIWARTGCLLLRGMTRSSRIGHHGLDVETSSVIQCRGQMLAWARSGQLSRFEDKLDRQMYRRLWTRHLCDTDFAQRHLRSLLDNLEYELRRDGQSFPRQMEQSAPYFQQLRTSYDTLTRSLKGLIATMGAEPVTQTTRALWLPSSIAPVALCEMWKNRVNSEAFSPYAADLTLWSQLSDSILGMVCLDDVVFACEQPRILSIDTGGRLHSESGPALQFADGSQYFIWHGVNVDQRIIDQPESITLQEIESTSNLETRRVLIERFGQARYLQESGAELVQEDECGVLYRQQLDWDEALVMVKVINSTAEPDGTFKEYFLRVPPETQTAKEAVAWTFGINPEEYEPDQQT